MGKETSENIGRILPWNRSTPLTLFDTYLASVTNLALMLLCGMVLLVFTYIIFKRHFVLKNIYDRALFFSPYLLAGSAFILFIITYIGASLLSETSFSDIRTIVMLFLLLLLPSLLLSKTFLKTVFSKKLLIILFILLVLIASFRVASLAYPKSVNDPISTVEDRRLSPLSKYYSGLFVKTYVQGGSISLDYITSLSLKGYYLASGNYTLRSLTMPAMTSSSIVIFNVNGLFYESMYVSSEAYSYAYNLSLTQCTVYNNGGMLIVVNDLG